MVNATVKHGSGYAQPAGAAVFMFSVFEILLKSLRADDDLNSLAAGAFAGALYRSPHGLKAAGMGSGIGLGLSAAWLILNPDSRQRIKEMLHMA
jgi:import inner membrane translocase subunit TIM23